MIETFTSELEVRSVEELIPWSNEGCHQTMKMKIVISENQVEKFIHECAEHFGEDWCKLRLDLNWNKDLDDEKTNS